MADTDIVREQRSKRTMTFVQATKVIDSASEFLKPTDDGRLAHCLLYQSREPHFQEIIMNTQSRYLNPATLAVAFAALFTMSLGYAANETMSVEARAPLQATLLPTVTINGNLANPDAEGNWSVANVRPTPVTLMPTVRVTADVEALAVSNLPTVQVVANVPWIADTTTNITSAPEASTNALARNYASDHKEVLLPFPRAGGLIVTP
jgi:hypothetical protein